MNFKKIILVSGLPRSMSTLLCNILCNNKKIFGGFTSPLLEFVHGARANYSTVPEVRAALTGEEMENGFLQFIRYGLDGYAKTIAHNADIYLDKSRGWIGYYDFLKQIIPDIKIIVPIRDLRCILSSFEKRLRAHPTLKDNRDIPAQQQFITIDQRVNSWLSDPPLGISMKRLYNAWQTKALENMLVVRAEDLSKNPEEIMRKVYKFIDEPYFEMDYNNVKQITVENDRILDYSIYGDHKIHPQVKPLKKDFDEILGKELSNNVKLNYRWFFEAFNYF